MATDSNEVGHYIVNAHRPGAVTIATQCSFLSPKSTDLIVVKSNRIEVRQYHNPNNNNSTNQSLPSSTSSSSGNNESLVPIVLDIPINGRIISLLSMKHDLFETDLLFFVTSTYDYAAISYYPNDDDISNNEKTAATSSSKKEAPMIISHRTITHAKGCIRDSIGRESECGIVSTYSRNNCIAIHLYDGFIKILPIFKNKQVRKNNKIILFGDAYNVRLEERTVLSMSFLPFDQLEEDKSSHVDVKEEDRKMPAKETIANKRSGSMTNTINPQLVLLHQDSRGLQHVISHTLDLKSKEMLRYPTATNDDITALTTMNKVMKKSRVDGGSGLLVPLSSNEILVVGQHSITYHRNSPTMASYVLPLNPPTIISSSVILSRENVLLGDEHGYLFILTLVRTREGGETVVSSLQLESLGITSISSCLVPLPNTSLVYVGSTFGNSQLVNILRNNNMELVEEYSNLGPIVDFDILQRSTTSTTNASSTPSQIVTCSGAAKDATIRLITNGIGMDDVASVELSGIQGMWNVRKNFSEEYDSFLVQSYMNETRILGFGVSSENDGEEGEMEEVVFPGLDAYSSTLYLSNVYPSDGLIQITPKEIRLLSTDHYNIVDVWTPVDGLITVANGNEAGQIVLSLRGGIVVYLQVENHMIRECARTTMEKEVSCISLHPLDIPLVQLDDTKLSESSTMEWENIVPIPSMLVAIGLWEHFSVRLLSLTNPTVLQENLSIDLGGDTQARSIVLCTLGQSSNHSTTTSIGKQNHMLLVGLGDGHLLSFSLLLQLTPNHDDNPRTIQSVKVHSKKKVSLGSQAISFRIFQNTTSSTATPRNPSATTLSSRKSYTTTDTCVFATGDRPTVIYITSSSSNSVSYNSKISFANVNLSSSYNSQMIVNYVTPFCLRQSSTSGSSSAEQDNCHCLCFADESNLRIGVIDNIQKLHVQTFPIPGESPRRITYHEPANCFIIGSIATTTSSTNSTAYASSSGQSSSEVDGLVSAVNMPNSILCLEDTNMEVMDRFDLDPNEIVLCVVSCTLKKVSSSSDGAYAPYIVVGTAYTYPDEDEPTSGRIIVLECHILGSDDMETDVVPTRQLHQVTEHTTRGGVYSICSFAHGSILACINSKTKLFRLLHEPDGILELQPEPGASHHGHILSQFVKSNTSSSDEEEKDPIAIVGDLMRSISVLQYSSQHKTLEEIARDYNANWTTAIEMISQEYFIGCENWNNLFVVKRCMNMNVPEEVRCRLVTTGEFHLGEMVNKFCTGALAMPMNAATTESSSGKSNGPSSNTSSLQTTTAKTLPSITIGSQTLFGTVDGSIGIILGLNSSTFKFFKALEQAMAQTLPSVGGLLHSDYRSLRADRRLHPCRGFIDGDLVESFLDLKENQMNLVVKYMNEKGGWCVSKAEDEGSMEEQEKEGRGDFMRLEEVGSSSGLVGGEKILSLETVLTRVEEMSRLH